jgi:hypothetical protein
VTGNIHLIGGSAGEHRHRLAAVKRPHGGSAPRRAGCWPSGSAFGHHPSMIAYWTHSLWLCKLMFWLFIPAIYFYIGPCFGLLNNLVALPHAQHVHRHIAAGREHFESGRRAAGGGRALSDWFAGGHATDARRCGLALAYALRRPASGRRIICGMASRTIVEDQQAGHRLHQSVGSLGNAPLWQRHPSIAAGCR